MHHSLKEPSLSSPVNAGLVYLKIFFQLVPYPKYAFEGNVSIYSIKFLFFFIVNLDYQSISLEIPNSHVIFFDFTLSNRFL